MEPRPDTLSGSDVHFRIFHEGAYILVPDLLRELLAAKVDHLSEGEREAAEAIEAFSVFLTRCAAKSEAF